MHLFRNKNTGVIWDVDPKSAAFRRIKANKADYEEVKAYDKEEKKPEKGAE